MTKQKKTAKKILVIDDANHIVSDIKKVFSDDKKFKVVGPDGGVTSYHEAIGLIRQHNPDYIALDMSLSDGNKEGIDIAAYLCGSYTGLVGIISSYDVPEVKRWVGRYGITHYPGGKNAEKFAECVRGTCECHLWDAYFSLKEACGKISSKEPKERVVISTRSKQLAIAAGQSCLEQLNGRKDVAVRVVFPDRLTYAMELESGIPVRVISDFVGDIRHHAVTLESVGNLAF